MNIFEKTFYLLIVAPILTVLMVSVISLLTVLGIATSVIGLAIGIPAVILIGLGIIFLWPFLGITTDDLKFWEGDE